MPQQIRILSTRKLLANQKQFLLNAGFSVIEADFITTKNKSFAAENINENIIFTSQNAVSSILAHSCAHELKLKNCFCVGEKTANMPRQNGFNVKVQTDYATALAEIIKEKYKYESFTFFSGNLRLETLPVSFKINGIQFREIEVYETALTPKNIAAPVEGILFFSPSAVESYLRENTINNENCFCIGTTTAKALEHITTNITIAKKPTIENAIIQCINHYKA